MKIKALITTLAILGTSSVAMARPVTTTASAKASVSWRFGSFQPSVVVRDHRTVTRPAPIPVYYSSDRWDRSDRYDRNERYERSDRYDRDSNWGRYEPRAMVLGDQLTFFDTQARKDVQVAANVGPLNTIKITADGGRTYILHIGIEFTSGQTQEIPYNRTISGNQEITIDLDGTNRSVNRIFVYRADGEAARVINAPHRGAFTVSAL